MNCPELTWSVPGVVNTVGLAFDIVGVILIFRYGIGPDIRRGGPSYLIVGEDPEEARRAGRYDHLGRTGLLLIIAGFGIQIFSNFL